jgi:hypothetical protein
VPGATESFIGGVLRWNVVICGKTSAEKGNAPDSSGKETQDSRRVFRLDSDVSSLNFECPKDADATLRLLADPREQARAFP